MIRDRGSNYTTVCAPTCFRRLEGGQAVTGWDTGTVAFVADDFAAWLVGLLADAGRRRLTTAVLGTDQERALRRAASTAVMLTAIELRPDGDGDATEMAMVVSQVFTSPSPVVQPAGQATLLEALQAAIAEQLAPLADPSLTGVGKSVVEVLGVPGAVLTKTLTGHLVREIVVRGARGGPLAPLAAQLNHDMTHLQGQRMEDILGRLDNEVRKALGRLGGSGALAPRALAQLPPVTAGFTGRGAELAVLADLLDSARPEGPAAVAAVAGLAGVGKTTLAVEAGHRAWRQGRFGGGVLFVDLHGYDDHRVEPGQALDVLLRALGVSAERVPATEEERAGLYRSVLAGISAPVLVIADNASSEAQVRPLLPGIGPHRMVVTSRHTLAGLKARLVEVAVLDEQAAADLLDAALRTARLDDDRITKDAEAATRLVVLCGGLPLALQIVAALLGADPTLGAAELAEELAVEQDRLERLAYDDGSRAGGLSVAAVFGLSYRRLGDVPARVFRLLPVNPGPDISSGVAAVLTDLPVRQARTVLADLARGHMAESAAGEGRWRMHDLLRLYARRLSDEHADADGREQSRDALLGYYLSRASAAADHLRVLPAMAAPGVFSSRESALAWLDAERANLVAAVSMAADTGRDTVAVRLPFVLDGYLGWRRRSDDSLTTLAVSLGVARRLGDRHSESAALVDLGRVLRQVRRFEEALTAAQDAAAIFRESDDRHGEGRALDSLGGTLQEMHRFGGAITAHQQAAAIFRETGDRHSEGIALLNLGNPLQSTQRFEEAISAYQDAAAIFRETGDRNSEGMVLNNLGTALRELMHRFDEAITAHQQAAAIFRETGDQHSEGTALGNLGTALRQVRRFEEAITAHQDAAAIFRKTGDQHDEGKVLQNLGMDLLSAGRFEEAVTANQLAASVFRETGDRRDEGAALRTMGMTLLRTGRFEDAVTAYQDAAAISRETGDRHDEGGALNSLGMALLMVSRPGEAVTTFQDAAAILRETGDREGEGIALCSVGPALLRAGRVAEAITTGEGAAARLRETGNRHGEGIVLNDLGLALLEAGRFEEAISAFQDAAAIFHQIGDSPSEGNAVQNFERATAARRT